MSPVENWEITFVLFAALALFRFAVIRGRLDFTHVPRYDSKAMKKALSCLLILFTAVVFLANAGHIKAQEAAAISMEASAPASVDYTLAYPGILPDNPLYFLKAARDRVVGFLISDIEKRAEFDLLTADKRINASYMLVKKGKNELAVTTLSKSNNYMEEALVQISKLAKTKENVNPMISNFKNAVSKHLDLLIGIKSKVGQKYLFQVEKEEKRLLKFKKSATQLSNKK